MSVESALVMSAPTEVSAQCVTIFGGERVGSKLPKLIGGKVNAQRI